MALEILSILESIKLNHDLPSLAEDELYSSIIAEHRRHRIELTEMYIDSPADIRNLRKSDPRHEEFFISTVYTALKDALISQDLKRLTLGIRGLCFKTFFYGGFREYDLDDVDEDLIDEALLLQKHMWNKRDYCLRYAANNYLCGYQNGQWKLTSLGNRILRLSELQAIRLLLTLEVFLHNNIVDEWHISYKFLEEILMKDKISLPSLRLGWLVDSDQICTYRYLIRLREFGLLGEALDDPNQLQMTGLGREVIKTILDREGEFDVLVPHYIREEISGSTSSEYDTADDLKRLKKILDSSVLIGELRDVVLDEVKRFQQTDASYISIFTALAPCIEGILRNLVTKEGLTVTNTGFKSYLDALVYSNKTILRQSTIQTLDVLVRPFRNMVEHGHVVSPEIARTLCGILLAAIESIHVDYLEYKNPPSDHRYN